MAVGKLLKLKRETLPRTKVYRTHIITVISRKSGHPLFFSSGLFPLPDSDSDSFPDGYIVLYRTFPTGSDSDSCTDSFPNGYYTHLRDGSPSQGQISVPIYYISIRGSESESKPVEKFCTVQESVSESQVPIRLRQ